MSSHDRDGMVRDNGNIQSNSSRFEQETEVDSRRIFSPCIVELELEAPGGSLRRDGLLKHHEILCHEARQLMDRKNRDYASGDTNGDPFTNFRLCEHMGICPTDQGMVIRLSDKIARLARLLAPGYSAKVADETITDTLMDVINYAVLISAYREDNAQVQTRGKI